MKFRVLGTRGEFERFSVEVFAACPREAEVFVTLRSMCQGSPVRIAGVLDVDRQSVHCTEMRRPELQDFKSMLAELSAVLRAGRVSERASREYRWLSKQIESTRIDQGFFLHCEGRLNRISGHEDKVDSSNEISEHLIRLAAIGMGLLESRSVPQTQNLLDLMWQVRATAILYRPILASGFNRPELWVVKSSC